MTDQRAPQSDLRKGKITPVNSITIKRIIYSAFVANKNQRKLNYVQPLTSTKQVFLLNTIRKAKEKSSINCRDSQHTVDRHRCGTHSVLLSSY